MEEYRIAGELLTAQSYLVPRGVDKVSLPNFYDEKGGMMEIALDVALNPAQNAQKYFKRYRKARSAQELAQGQKEKTLKEMEILEQALSYPGEVTADRETLQGVLEKVGLASLAGKLGETDDWSRILSLGEQQRLAFARVLLARPLWVFLDEATSALDEDREQEMYDLLKDELPDLGIMSVGHRSTLLRQHEEKLLLDGQGGWQLSAI
jgi:ABC-type transport system involved in cytochrome bd biosynthesis fused ATPase/permease subunit